jgi:hypothetical protein
MHFIVAQITTTVTPRGEEDQEKLVMESAHMIAALELGVERRSRREAEEAATGVLTRTRLARTRDQLMRMRSLRL